MTPSSAKFTYEDLLRFPPDDLRHEIIDGVHFVNASPNLYQNLLLSYTIALNQRDDNLDEVRFIAEWEF